MENATDTVDGPTAARARPSQHIAGPVLVALAALLALGGAQTALAQATREERVDPSPGELAKMQALTPEHFEQRITLRDDDLETIAEMSTAQGYNSKGRFTDPVRSDNFLRAFLVKATSAVRFQLYQTVTYTGSPRGFSSVSYATPDGPVSQKITDISHDVLTCYGSLCSFQDTIGFDIPEDVLRSVANDYAPGGSRPWRFRFAARSGIPWEDQLLPAEAAGLLRKVDAWRAARGPR